MTELEVKKLKYAWLDDRTKLAPIRHMILRLIATIEYERRRADRADTELEEIRKNIYCQIPEIKIDGNPAAHIPSCQISGEGDK